ncbi:16S rRNA (cytidine(1402)-2'-O)-methyltransferase [soil metagenome]
MSGKLFIIGTPIGNLADISPRVIDALNTCDLILAEDTRISIKILNHLGLKKRMLSCHKFNEHERLRLLEESNRQSQTIGLISDAGMPLISDPGHPVVELAIALGMEIIPIAGPSAFVLALVGSGLPLDRFCFEGFLPDKPGELNSKVQSLAKETRTSVYYVSPHKVERTVEAFLASFGDRKACLVRELTKVHEEFVRGSLATILERVKGQLVRGECVLVVGGCETVMEDMSDWLSDEGKREKVHSYINDALNSGVKLSRACAEAAKEFGISRSDIYRDALARQ